MTEAWIVDALLSLAVAAAWAAGWGFTRRRRALNLLHSPSVIASTTGSALVLAGLFGEGLTARVGKLLLLDGLVLVSALVLAHALARSALRRAKWIDDAQIRQAGKCSVPDFPSEPRRSTAGCGKQIRSSRPRCDSWLRR